LVVASDAMQAGSGGVGFGDVAGAEVGQLDGFDVAPDQLLHRSQCRWVASHLFMSAERSRRAPEPFARTDHRLFPR